MAAVDTELEDEVEQEAPPKRKWLSGKRLTLFFILPAILLGGGGAGLYLSGIADPYIEEYLGGGEDDAAKVQPAVFFDLPELLVNLDNGDKQVAYLRLKISLEITSPEDTARLEQVLPRVIDNFQVYLRELRVDDLKGSAGLFRLKEELLVRVNAAAAPVRVKDILFNEMIIQ